MLKITKTGIYKHEFKCECEKEIIFETDDKNIIKLAKCSNCGRKVTK